MKKILLLFNTVKYLKWEQIYFRIIRMLRQPRVMDSFQGPMPIRPKLWQHLLLYSDKITNSLNISFLSVTKTLDLPNDWNNEYQSKLWVYNLHYFEDLLSESAEDKTTLHCNLLNRWVDENPVGYGNGWEPYPTSLRVVNILKAWLGGLELDEKLFTSVFEQASFLSSDLETHLLGNHYFVNLKALLFAGVVFRNNEWIVIAEKGLLDQIPEQIQSDGSNFELSPMYHSLMLIDMLDMINLSKAYPDNISSPLTLLLQDYIPKMLAFMDAMAHPDEGVSFFNDSADGIAPAKSIIVDYARRLGFNSEEVNYSNALILDNANSGYICATTRCAKLIFDGAEVGPDYIPAHAHADTLSFELSVGTQRVFVNTGTSQYGSNVTRITERKTRSHNTVEVDDKDSSQVWGAFRVAKRAKVFGKLLKHNLDDSFEIQSSHNGYKTFFGGCIHTRKILFSENSLSVNDLLKGTFRSAKSRFYIHPDLRVSLKSNVLEIIGDKFVLISDLRDLKVGIEDSSWCPRFGMRIPNKVLVIDFDNLELDVTFDWSPR